MAMICGGYAKCAICDKQLEEHLIESDEFVATTHFISDDKSPLWPYSDAVMHCECFVAWPLHSQFIAAYNEAMRDVINRHGTHSHMNEDGMLVQLDEEGHVFVPDEVEEERYFTELIASLPSQQPPTSLPTNIETRLRKGKPMAAEVFCERDGWRAWAWVNPIMKSGKTWAQVQQERSRTRQATFYDDTIARYQVRYVELSDWHLADERFLDLDLAIEERPIVDENWEVEDVESLLQILRKWVPNLSRLRVPSKADYPDPPPSGS